MFLHRLVTASLLLNAAVPAITVGSVAQATPAQPGAPTGPCDASRIKAPENTTIVSAKAVAGPSPYCRIDGYVTTQNPGPNRVNFMVAMPDKWNGRYIFTVQGGAAGFVPDPAPENLAEGYAIASTDKGVITSNIMDFSFRSNPAMNYDWNYRGTHVAAVATQDIARQYFGRDKLYRYVMGCSGGGIGTLTEAERYPQDFDGFIPASMSTDWPFSPSLNWALIAQRVSMHPESWISAGEYEQVRAGLLAKYDVSDGAVDGLIWNPSVIKLDAADRQALGFLSDEQFKTLKLIASDITDKDGKVLAPGYSLGNPDSMARFLTGVGRPPWTSLRDYPGGFMVVHTAAQSVAGESFTYLADRDIMSYPRPMPGIDVGVEYDHRRLKDLVDRGGKLLLWAGLADEAIPARQVSGYYERAVAAFPAQAAKSFRFFGIPGLHHCLGGLNAPNDTADKALKAVERWVEQGVAPNELLLTNTHAPGPTGGIPASMIPSGLRAAAAAAAKPAPTSLPRTYRVCAAPAHSVFKGGPANRLKLDVNDARNWSCSR